MSNHIRRFVAIVAIGLAPMMPMNKVFAESENGEFDDLESFKLESFNDLSALWWQWALSIPASVNPQLDETGENAVVGQRGSVWFLAGAFSGGTVIRKMVFVPEGTALFFPVANAINFNTPNVCGQGPENLSVRDMRAASADFVNGVTNLSVTVDDAPIRNLRRIKSEVFEVALPKENVFVSACAPGGLPAGVYSPAVDDGIYALLKPLPVGLHTLHFHAENPSKSFIEDVTYNLTIVPVVLK
jgi:hypothetical protein